MHEREKEKDRDLYWSPGEWPYFRYRRAFAPDPNYTVLRWEIERTRGKCGMGRCRRERITGWERSGEEQTGREEDKKGVQRIIGLDWIG